MKGGGVDVRRRKEGLSVERETVRGKYIAGRTEVLPKEEVVVSFALEVAGVVVTVVGQREDASKVGPAPRNLRISLPSEFLVQTDQKVEIPF